MLVWSLLLILNFAHASEDVCRLMCPSSLSFIEKLNHNLAPSDVIVFTGGESKEHRQKGFAKVSADSIEAFTSHHGYRLVFTDNLNYNFHLVYKGQQYTSQWHKIFSLPALRHKYPKAKYFIWIDESIFVTYPETDMLNHYMNLMERDEDWEMMFGDDGNKDYLNTGVFIVKNSPFTEWALERAMDIGLENNGSMARTNRFERDALEQVRRRNSLHNKIRIIPHRTGPYNFNTFAREFDWDLPSDQRAEKEDAFIRFSEARNKLDLLKEWIEYLDEWKLYTSGCSFPLQI